MRIQIATMTAIATLLPGCQEPEPREADAALEGRAVTAEPAAPGVFVDAPVPDAQLVFVGEDRSVVPSGSAGAVFVPFSTFSIERDGIPNEFPPPDSMAALLADAGVHGDDVVIVGEPIPAGRAYAAFDYLGLGDRAALLDGGPAAAGDAAASQPATTAATPSPDDPRGGELEIDVREDMIVDAEWVREHLDDTSVAILDARPPAEYSGETPGDGIDRPGHIPGAHNVFWQTLIRSPDDPRLKDEAELRRIFEAAGVGPDDTVVSYCRTGGQASFLYTVARHLGYETRLYDGSFIDWSRTEYPVER